MYWKQRIQNAQGQGEAVHIQGLMLMLGTKECTPDLVTMLSSAFL